MHAIGSGTAYNPFVRELSTYSPSTFSPPGVSIAALPGTGSTQYVVAGSPSPTWIWVRPDGSMNEVSSDIGYSLTSAPDIGSHADADYSSVFYESIVAFTAAGLVDYSCGSGAPIGCFTAAVLSPPSSTAFSYSPTLCNSTGSNWQHIAAIAGGKLYYTYAPTGSNASSGFSVWELAGDAVPASSPDCTVTSDGTVHIVVLTSTGTIADVHGNSGSWTTTNLGTF